MCYQLVERYSACRCLHYQHAVDRCAAFGQPGHGVQLRTILVGYACSQHSAYGTSSYEYASPDRRYQQQHHQQQSYSDSGYHSGRSSSSKGSSRGHR